MLVVWFLAFELLISAAEATITTTTHAMEFEPHPNTTVMWKTQLRNATSWNATDAAIIGRSQLVGSDFYVPLRLSGRAEGRDGRTRLD
jgi:hypothetical protein